MMETIVHVIVDGPYLNGYGYQENFLTAKHKELGYDVHIITCGDMNEAPRVYKDVNGIPVHVLARNASFLRRIPGIVGWVDKSVGLTPMLEELQPDIIFVHNICQHDILRIIKYKKTHPGVKLFGDNHSDYYNTPVTGLRNKYVRRIIGGYIGRRFGAVAEMVWGVTPWRVKYLKEVYRVPAKKVGLLVMGGDEKDIRWEERSAIRRDIRKQLAIPEEAFVVISGGKMDKAKKTHRLIEAIRQLSPKHQIHLIIFGRVEKDLSEYMSQVKDANIHILGWLTPKETNDYYLASDLACFPGSHSTLWEQANACGLPGIFKDWDGGYSHIDIGGNCILLKADTSDAIAQAIEHLTTHPTEYDAMKLVAETKCRKIFSYTRIAKKAIGKLSDKE